MGLIEAWIKVLVYEHVSILAATLVVSSILTFAILNGGNQKPIKGGIYSVQEKDKKIVNYEAVLVGASEEKTWSWLAELRAKFRYMGEGHHLMFTAFKKVRLLLPFVNMPSC